MPSGSFTITLVKSGHRLNVSAHETILQVLRNAGIDVPSACEQGICGSCETTVLAGEPDHQDLLMTPQEHAKNNTMMICCSGALSDNLVLDL